MTCNVEEWRDIPGYEGLYMVSSMGRVKSLPKYLSKTDRILRGCVDKDGYIKVRLCPNPQLRKSYFVHRLVALAFIDNELQLPEIDHLNTIKDDNRAENLRWCTHKENINNKLTIKKKSAARTGKKHSPEAIRKMSEAHKGKKLPSHVCELIARLNRNPVLMMDTNGNAIAVFSSIKEAGMVTGVNPRRISDVCLNKEKKQEVLYGKKYNP